MKIWINNSIQIKNTQLVISLLEKTPYEIANLTLGIDPEQLQTRPNPESWSVVAILAHLHACATIWKKVAGLAHCLQSGAKDGTSRMGSS